MIKSSSPKPKAHLLARKSENNIIMSKKSNLTKRHHSTGTDFKNISYSKRRCLSHRSSSTASILYNCQLSPIKSTCSDTSDFSISLSVESNKSRKMLLRILHSNSERLDNVNSSIKRSYTEEYNNLSVEFEDDSSDCDFAILCKAHVETESVLNDRIDDEESNFVRYLWDRNERRSNSLAIQERVLDNEYLCMTDRVSERVINPTDIPEMLIEKEHSEAIICGTQILPVKMSIISQELVKDPIRTQTTQEDRLYSELDMLKEKVIERQNSNCTDASEILLQRSQSSAIISAAQILPELLHESIEKDELMENIEEDLSNKHKLPKANQDNKLHSECVHILNNELREQQYVHSDSVAEMLLEGDYMSPMVSNDTKGDKADFLDDVSHMHSLPITNQECISDIEFNHHAVKENFDDVADIWLESDYSSAIICEAQFSNNSNHEEESQVEDDISDINDHSSQGCITDEVYTVRDSCNVILLEEQLSSIVCGESDIPSQSLTNLNNAKEQERSLNDDEELIITQDYIFSKCILEETVVSTRDTPENLSEICCSPIVFESLECKNEAKGLINNLSSNSSKEVTSKFDIDERLCSSPGTKTSIIETIEVPFEYVEAIENEVSDPVEDTGKSSSCNVNYAISVTNIFRKHLSCSNTLSRMTEEGVDQFPAIQSDDLTVDSQCTGMVIPDLLENKVLVNEDDVELIQDIIDSLDEYSILQIDLAESTTPSLPTLVVKTITKSSKSRNSSKNPVLNEAVVEACKNAEDEDYKEADIHLSKKEQEQLVIHRMYTIFEEMLLRVKRGKKLFIPYPTHEFKNCTLQGNSLVLGNRVSYCSRKRTSSRFDLVLFLMKKIIWLYKNNSSCTARKLFYDLKTSLNCSMRSIRDGIIFTSYILNVPNWYFNIYAGLKGLAYGNVKITIDNEVIDLNMKSTNLIPQDVSKITLIDSRIYFILIIEKDTVFQKFFDEDIPNKLEKPFLLVTGKGYADLNTLAFVRKIWINCHVPVFILVDADPHGIEIFLTYKFGSLTNVHLSQFLSIPSIMWLGIHPSEFELYDLNLITLSKGDVTKLERLLDRPYLQNGHNLKIRKEISLMLEKNCKVGIEQFMKCKNYLGNVYLPEKIIRKYYF